MLWHGLKGREREKQMAIECRSSGTDFLENQLHRGPYGHDCSPRYKQLQVVKFLCLAMLVHLKLVASDRMGRGLS